MADVGGIAGDQLKSYIERAERLREEKKALDDDLKELFAECRGNGFDVKAVKHILKLRQQDKDERDEFETIVDIYMRAIGMLPDFESGTESATHVRYARETDIAA